MAVGVAAAGLATGLVLTAGLHYAGPKGAIAPLLAILCVVLLRFPGVAFGLLVVGTVMAEAEGIGVFPSGEAFYNKAISSLTPPDILLLLGLGGVLLRFAGEDERPRLPDPLTLPLILLSLALLAGVVTGASAHITVATGDLFHRSMHVIYLVAVPVLAVNVLRDTRSLKLFAGVAAALAVVKAPSGLYDSLGGEGGAVEEGTASYLSPLPNLMMLTLILGTAAALVRRVRLPVWVLVGAPLALAALLLSYRRSFWIAAAFTLVVVVILASRHRGRAVLAIGGVVLALTLVAVATVPSDPSASPITERAQTITPGGLGTNRGDRYRMDERANVIENIEAHPLTGIGLGVPWAVHQPLAEEHDRRYAHVATLWYWLAFGPLGLIAYLAVMGGGLWTASRIWRRHPDPVVQISALALFGAILGLLIVELTATFTGVEPRVSLILGAGLGWLAAAWRDLPSESSGSTSQRA
jgi:hypothetical protein